MCKCLVSLLLAVSCHAQFSPFFDPPEAVASSGDVVTNGLVGWWKLDETSGTSAADSAPIASPHNGTLTNAPSWVAGKFGNALQFTTASSQSVGVPSVGLNSVSAATLSFWVRRASSANYVDCGWAILNSGAFTSAVYSDNNVYNAADNPTAQYGSFSTTFDTNWHSVILVFDGSLSGNSNRLKVYYDGTQKTLSFVGTIQATLSATLGNLNMGFTDASPDRYSTGFIDDVRVYNRALSGSEVTELQSAP